MALSLQNMLPSYNRLAELQKPASNVPFSPENKDALLQEFGNWNKNYSAFATPSMDTMGGGRTKQNQQLQQINASPQGQRAAQLYQYALQQGWVKPPSHDWMDTVSDRIIPGVIQGATYAGIGAGLGGIAGVGPAAGGGGATGTGSGLNTAMGGMGGGAMDTAGGGLALTNPGTYMPGASAAAGGATGGIAAGGAFGGAIPGYTGAMNATGAAIGGNAAGVGVGGTAAGATAAGGAALNGASGGGWFNNFAQGLGQGTDSALSGQNLLNLGVGAGIDALAADRARNQANSAADKAAGLADPFASQRPQYQAQLSNLMAHPESINQDPSYKFRFQSGQDALERSNVARGFLGSGNMLHDLQDYGQQSASQELNNQYARLAQLSGGMSGPGYAGNVFGGLANTGLADSANMSRSLGTAGGALIRGITGTGSTGNNYTGGFNQGNYII